MCRYPSYTTPVHVMCKRKALKCFPSMHFHQFSTYANNILKYQFLFFFFLLKHEIQ